MARPINTIWAECVISDTSSLSGFLSSCSDSMVSVLSSITVAMPSLADMGPWQQARFLLTMAVAGFLVFAGCCTVRLRPLPFALSIAATTLAVQLLQLGPLPTPLFWLLAVEGIVLSVFTPRAVDDDDYYYNSYGSNLAGVVLWGVITSGRDHLGPAWPVLFGLLFSFAWPVPFLVDLALPVSRKPLSATAGLWVIALAYIMSATFHVGMHYTYWAVWPLTVLGLYWAFPAGAPAWWDVAGSVCIGLMGLAVGPARSVVGFQLFSFGVHFAILLRKVFFAACTDSEVACIAASEVEVPDPCQEMTISWIEQPVESLLWFVAQGPGHRVRETVCTARPRPSWSFISVDAATTVDLSPAGAEGKVTITSLARTCSSAEKETQEIQQSMHVLQIEAPITRITRLGRRDGKWYLYTTSLPWPCGGRSAELVPDLVTFEDLFDGPSDAMPELFCVSLASLRRTTGGIDGIPTYDLHGIVVRRRRPEQNLYERVGFFRTGQAKCGSWQQRKLSTAPMAVVQVV